MEAKKQKQLNNKTKESTKQRGLSEDQQDWQAFTQISQRTQREVPDSWN